MSGRINYNEFIEQLRVKNNIINRVRLSHILQNLLILANVWPILNFNFHFFIFIKITILSWNTGIETFDSLIYLKLKENYRIRLLK